MGKRYSDWLDRVELKDIMAWCREPAKSPEMYLVQFAVKDFLEGLDPYLQLCGYYKVPEFQARRAVEKARLFLNNERLKRKLNVEEIVKQRQRFYKTFTHENFRVNVEKMHGKDYGMTQFSIYCTVEVFDVKEDLDVEKEYLINFSDHKTKEWLVRLLVWGLTNAKEIIIKPATEEQMSNMRMFVPKEKERVA